MRIQTLREQWDIARSQRNTRRRTGSWTLLSLIICKRVDETGSGLTRKPDGGRPWSVRTPEMIEQFGELICSQENQPETSKSTRKIAEQLNIRRSSVQRIVKRDLQLPVFRRVPAQIVSESVNLNAVRNLSVTCQWNSRRRSFLLMKKTFTWTLLLTIKMIVFGPNWQEAIRRQKAPGSGEGEIRQARHSLFWCAMAEKEDFVSFQARQK